MEFNEKLQELRKNRGLTQEELAERLFVSRAAVSKWEQGRGYPSIESLRDISRFFSVSIDDLLSSEKVLFIAENENKANIRKLCDLLLSVADLFSFLLIVLPLYPSVADGFVYSVNLLRYTQATPLNKTLYWFFFVFLLLCGVLRLLVMKKSSGRYSGYLTVLSVSVNTFAVLFLAVAREPYAVVLAFFVLLFKAVVIFTATKNGVIVDKKQRI